MQDFPRIQDTDLSLDTFEPIASFPACGGTGIFVGTVRNHHEGRGVEALQYTSYAPVAEKIIRAVEQEIQEKYGVSYVRVIHRVGKLEIGDYALIAIAYAPHRREAFQACEEAVERVKHEAPVWKEEFYTDGSSQYIAGCCIRRDYDQDEPMAHAKHTHSHSHSHGQHHHDHSDCDRG